MLSPQPAGSADIASLTASVKSTLQAQGALHSIRAQLRARVYGALSGQQVNPKSSLAASPEAKLVLALLGEFLNFYELRSTECTAAAEIIGWDSRADSSEAADVLGLESQHQPLLLQLVQARRELLGARAPQQARAETVRAATSAPQMLPPAPLPAPTAPVSSGPAAPRTLDPLKSRGAASEREEKFARQAREAEAARREPRCGSHGAFAGRGVAPGPRLWAAAAHH